MSKTKPKLIIIDGNALIHRSFHAIPPTLRTKDGRLVNAVYGFTSFLLKALNEFHPEFVVLTLDKKGPTFRHEAYSEYKATRVKAPDELYEQIPLVKEVAEAFNIPIFELSGFEADDLIGTICAQAQNEKNLEKIIITGDLDTLQLVNEKTKVYTMSRGLSDCVLYNDDKVRERYNLNPDQIIDYKALRGDPSDNIPGVKGIGEKTAIELLNDFKTLDGVYKAVENNDKKIRERILSLLKEYRGNAYLSQELATINLATPIKFILNDTAYSNFQLDKVINLFSEFEFRSLLNKVKDLRDTLNKDHGSAENINQSADEIKNNPNSEAKFKRNEDSFKYELIDTETKFVSFLKKIKEQKSFTIDTETAGLDTLNDKLIGLSFSWKKGEAYFILNTPDRLEKLKPLLEDELIKKSGHNLKFDFKVLKNQNINLKGIYFDTMLASYLLNPASRQHNLDSLVFTEIGFEKISKKNLAATQPEQLTLDFLSLDPTKLSLYACEDADFTNRLVSILEKKLKAEKLFDLFTKIEMPLIKVLGIMENNGIKLEISPLNKLNKEVNAKLKTLESAIHKFAKTKFNINSTKQLKEILFEKLAIPTANLKKTKTGFSTAEDELEKLKDLHPIISLLQDYRELKKLSSTYLNALPIMINPKTGRIHSNFNQTITATGRLSSNEPNLQNIPTRTEEGKKIRAAFVADPGYKLVSFDYSQIELRLAAHMANDLKMIKAFNDKEDIHQATAAEINEVKLEEVTKKMRQEAKAINFGILYGQGPHGLAQSAGIPYFQAKEFIDKYFIAYPNIHKTIANYIKEASDNGYALTLFGRRRPLPEINSSIPIIRKSAERMAINTPVQGTAADLIKLAMINIDQLIAGHEDEIRMVLQVHDELIFEIKEAKLDFYSPKIKDLMENVLPLKVPIIAEENIGNNWGELK
jgi:DNA polymerase-1